MTHIHMLWKLLYTSRSLSHTWLHTENSYNELFHFHHILELTKGMTIKIEKKKVNKI